MRKWHSLDRIRAAGLFSRWSWLAISPSVARAQDKSDSKASFDLYGHVMLDAGLPHGPVRPRLVRRDAADQAAGLRGRVRSRRPGVLQRPSDAIRREVFGSDQARGPQDLVRVRNVRSRLRRRADDDPSAARVRRAGVVRGRDRRGARSWTSTCSRTRSSTGARPEWCSSGTSRSAGCRSRATRA